MRYWFTARGSEGRPGFRSNAEKKSAKNGGKAKLLPPETNAWEPIEIVQGRFKCVEDGWSMEVPSSLQVTVDKSQTFTDPSADDETNCLLSRLSDRWWILALCPKNRWSSFPESTSHNCKEISHRWPAHLYNSAVFLPEFGHRQLHWVNAGHYAWNTPQWLDHSLKSYFEGRHPCFP